MKYLLLALLLTGCISTGDSEDTQTASIDDSFNDNSVSGADIASDKCDSENYLIKNCDVESFLNCSDECGLEDGEDTPEKKACDRACIKERFFLASDFCYKNNGCKVKQEQEDPEVVSGE